MNASQMFTAADYAVLHALVFRSDYPGYKPDVIESPNGDAAALDAGKRYAHVATKYLDQLPEDTGMYPHNRKHLLHNALHYAWRHALKVADSLCVPYEFMPSYAHGALRVLEYPAGEGGHVHTDFDLFALNLYRNVANPGLSTLGGREYHMGEIGAMLPGLGAAEPHHVTPLSVAQHSLIYFAIPDHAAVLPSGETVGEWLQERISRSRYEVAK